MFQKKFRLLKAFRKLLPDRLLDHPRSRKSDQRPRLCQNHIPQHRKTCRHPSGCRIGQHGHIKTACIAVSFQCGRSLRHLHQGNNPLLHSGASGTGKEYDRKPFALRTFDQSRDLLPDNLPHARHDEAAVADSDRCLDPPDRRFSGQNRFIESGTFFQQSDLFFISFIIQRIFCGKMRIPLFKAPLIRNKRQTTKCIHSEIVSAFGADIMSFLHILCDDHRFTCIAFFQQPLRDFRSFPFSGFLTFSGGGRCFFKSVFQFHFFTSFL